MKKDSREHLKVKLNSKKMEGVMKEFGPDLFIGMLNMIDIIDNPKNYNKMDKYEIVNIHKMKINQLVKFAGEKKKCYKEVP